MSGRSILLISLWVSSLCPALEGSNAGVEISVEVDSPSCGLGGGDAVEFLVSARNMSNVRQIKLELRWEPSSAVDSVTAQLTEAGRQQGLIAPFAPDMEGSRAEFGLATFGAGINGEVSLARLGFELAAHVDMSTPIAIWIEAVSLGPSFAERDTIRPVQATALSNFCDGDRRTLEQVLFVSPQEEHLFFSPSPSGQVADGSKGEAAVRARFFSRGLAVSGQTIEWTLDNQGSAPFYAFAEGEAIHVGPGSVRQAASVSDERGEASVLLDAEPGLDPGPAVAALTFCGELEGGRSCATSRLTWDLLNTAVVAALDFHPGRSLQLEQNYPNPFNEMTSIPFSLPGTAAAPVRLEIFNLAGQVVRTLARGRLSPGSYTLTWNGRDRRGEAVASGLYFYRLRLGPEERAGRMLLLR